MNYVRETLAIDRIQRILDSVDPRSRVRVADFCLSQEMDRQNDADRQAVAQQEAPRSPASDAD